MNNSISALSQPPCAQCRPNDRPDQAARRRMLQLLALLEHPRMLPAGLALRLGAELMAMTAAEPQLVCTAVARGDA